MTIGQVAKLSGLAPSTIRFYEQSGVMPRPVRAGGKRRYDQAALERLAVVERAKDCGFSLAQVRTLFSGFRDEAPAPERWQRLASEKLAELDELARKVAAMQEMLRRPCECQDLAECGRRIFAHRRVARRAP